ncbi:type VI secretion system Vgr family protein [uncultured Thiodictyon sp.]|uniref:type VI secretion system Vgr family protein n=1 Tax=uncultured Thiodictyon sp. TaxID=1846217 RepID=UPI0025F49B68|nr:type VI secretion system Vgr family protein [uncultured Thiodictyon sp.]
MNHTQHHRPFQVFTPLPFDTLLFYRMSGEEDLGRMFRYELDLLSEAGQIDAKALLGRPMCVRVEGHDRDPADPARWFHGIVQRFSLVGFQGRLAHYQAELRPWCWFLTRTADCRIFQDQSALEIAKQIFREHGYTDFDDLTGATYRPRDYCVQYRETDFHFISRLLEHEGIYYYFLHDKDKHQLVLADSPSSHSACRQASRVPYYAGESAGASPFKEYLSQWRLDQTVCSGAFVHTAFDFTKPLADLTAGTALARGHANDHHEVFDYPEPGCGFSEIDGYSRVRIEELQSEHSEGRGMSNARGLASGCLFDLTGHPLADQNREYLVKSTHYQLETAPYATGDDVHQEDTFAVEFTTRSSQEPFRPARSTPKARMQGPQTAIVVGKAGEEIWTDQYGRVKVQFHWDRYGKRDEQSSCWLRVSQPWAGKGWGGISIPRIGQEVIVDFLEGDPDQPIITGRVYNAAAMPPYGLPAGAVVSGIKSQTHKGAGYNEIAMNDTAGSELLRVNAQYDQSTNVNHDRTETIGNDQSVSIVNNRTDQVGVDAKEDIGANLSLAVGANRKESVGGNDSLSVGGNKTETISIASAETVGAVKALSVGAAYQISVGAAMNTTVGLASFEQVGVNKHILAGSKIVFECGGGKITIASSGKITIEGTEIAIKASGPVDIDGSVVDLN